MMVPTQAVTVGPVETWKAEKVSIWQAGQPRQPLRHAAHDLDDLQGSCPTAAVPMSLLADHPNVQFNFYRPGIGIVAAEMH